MLQSAVLMLRHIGETTTADRLHTALEAVFRPKQHLTRDVGGTASTTEFADAVIQEIQSPAPAEAQ